MSAGRRCGQKVRRQPMTTELSKDQQKFLRSRGFVLIQPYIWQYVKRPIYGKGFGEFELLQAPTIDDELLRRFKPDATN